MVFIRSGAAAFARTSAAGMKTNSCEANRARITAVPKHTPQQASTTGYDEVRVLYRSLLAAHLHQSQRTAPHPSINIVVSHHITSRRRSRDVAPGTGGAAGRGSC